MRFTDIKIGFAFTGSHCTIGQVLQVLEVLKNEGADLFPIFSPAVRDTDTRFGTAAEVWDKVVQLTGKEPMTELVEVEPIGPKKLFDVLVVAPCTGNTLAKLALGISDTSVTLACKAHLRNNRPVVLAIATNDALSTNARNLGFILNRKQVFLVPLGQDAPQSKATSMVANMELIPDTLLEALQGKQLQPVFYSD